MIVGIGTDIVSSERAASVFLRFGDRFMKKIFSERERNYLRKFRAQRLTQSIGASFAAKEALAKALGTGFRNGVSFREIEVVRNRFGKPLVRLSGKTEQFARSIGARRAHLSISHEKSHSVAVVVLES